MLKKVIVAPADGKRVSSPLRGEDKGEGDLSL
jgi:hypothetical protein